MYKKSFASIEDLPVELVHRIFDNIDFETIFISIRLVSKSFQLIVNSYNRFRLDFKLISKRNFLIISRLINPSNVLSLILSNDKITSNQIELFLSFNHLDKFLQLRCLTLIQIDELQLQIILKQINLNYLQSFSFSIRKYQDSITITTTNLLQFLIKQPNLRNLEFNIKFDRSSMICWPTISYIQSLIIHGKISLEHLMKICESSPYLSKLILNEFPIGNLDNLDFKSFPQIFSLTIKNVRVNIDDVQLFLLLFPSLIHLKLIGGKMMINGRKWENFIQRNLLNLNQFEFYFCQWELINLNSHDLQIILSSFETSFWIEEKHWFIICQYDYSSTSILHLYSIPICKYDFIYEKRFQTISLSTFPKKQTKSLSITTNILSLDCILNKSLSDHIQQKRTTNSLPFPNVKNLNLVFYEKWPLISLEKLCLLIDITKITHLTISNNYLNEYYENNWKDISKFLRQGKNLYSLIIQNNFDKFNSNKTIDHLAKILPKTLKHLQISIKNLQQIFIIFKSNQNLSTIIFDSYETNFHEQIIQWFNTNTRNSTWKKSHGKVSIWIGKINSDTN